MWRGGTNGAALSHRCLTCSDLRTFHKAYPYFWGVFLKVERSKSKMSKVLGPQHQTCNSAPSINHTPRCIDPKCTPHAGVLLLPGVPCQCAGRTWNYSDRSMKRWETFGVFPTGRRMLRSGHVYQFPLDGLNPSATLTWSRNSCDTFTLGTERYRGTSLIRKCNPLGPYRRPMPRVLGGSWGGWRFLMGEVPQYV